MILPDRPLLPVWFTAASDVGLDALVADSVGFALPDGPRALEVWATDTTGWHDRLLTPFLTVVRERLGVRAEPTAAEGRLIAWRLAERAAQVRWGTAAGTRFAVLTDASLREALHALGQIPVLLAPPGN